MGLADTREKITRLITTAKLSMSDSSGIQTAERQRFLMRTQARI